MNKTMEYFSAINPSQRAELEAELAPKEAQKMFSETKNTLLWAGVIAVKLLARLVN
jgi:hypothetical protein